MVALLKVPMNGYIWELFLTLDGFIVKLRKIIVMISETLLPLFFLFYISKIKLIANVTCIKTNKLEYTEIRFRF